MFISSPYSAATEQEREENVRKTYPVAKMIFERGGQPFIPLLFHYYDLEYARPWVGWMETCLVWLRVCDVVVRIPGKSKGADIEVAEAQRLGIPVYYLNTVA